MANLYESMTLEQLNVELERLHAERQAAAKRYSEVQEYRDKLVRDDELNYWGLNEVQYQAAIAKSVSSARPAHVCLQEARKEANRQLRQSQTAQAGAAATGVAGHSA